MDPEVIHNVVDFYYEHPSLKDITPVYNNQGNRCISWAVVATDCIKNLTRIEGLKYGPTKLHVPPLLVKELIKWLSHKVEEVVVYLLKMNMFTIWKMLLSI